MGAAASCLCPGWDGSVEVSHAFLSRGSKQKEVRDFTRTERDLNVHVQFNTTCSLEKCVVTWKAIKVKGGAYKSGQVLFVDEFSLKKVTSIVSTYTRSSAKKAWPAGSYKVEVRMVNLLSKTSSMDNLGRKKLTGYLSKKKVVEGASGGGGKKFGGGKALVGDDGRLVLTLPYTID